MGNVLRGKTKSSVLKVLERELQSTRKLDSTFSNLMSALIFDKDKEVARKISFAFSENTDRIRKLLHRIKEFD
jgi:hypothetical protein